MVRSGQKHLKYERPSFVEEDNVPDGENDGEIDDAQIDASKSAKSLTDENDGKGADVPKASKILERRRSKRISDRSTIVLSDDEEIFVGPNEKKAKTTNAPALKGASKTKKKTPPKGAATSKSKSPKQTSPKTATEEVRASKTTTQRPDFGIKAKCELTAAILSQFEDYRKDPNYKTRYSAVCSLCNAKSDDDDEHEVVRTHFLKGNNTNLKSHLKRVITVEFKNWNEEFI